jgi:hypothetical protein
MTTTNSAAPVRNRTKRDLVHLRSLPGVEPRTSTGTVAWIWPEIADSLTTGKKLREVWEAARADGLEIPYPQFRVYVSRIRMRHSRQHRSETKTTPHAAVCPNAEPQPESPVRPDPFRNVREQREKKQSDGFGLDPFSIQRPLID